MRWYFWVLEGYFLISWFLFIYNSDLLFSRQSLKSRVKRTIGLAAMCVFWIGWAAFRIYISDTLNKIVEAKIDARRNAVYTTRLNRLVREAKSETPPDDLNSRKEG